MDSEMRITKLALVFALIAGTANAQSITPGASVTGGLSLSGPRTGRFVTTVLQGGPQNVALSAANRLLATPVFIAAPATLQSMSFDIGTGNAAAWNARMCLYADANGLPGSLAVDSGTVAIASGSVTGIQTVGSLAVSLSGPAWYWAAIMADSNSESLYSANSANGAFLSQSIIGAPSVAAIVGTSFATGVFGSQTFGACPATFPAASYNNGAATPLVFLGF